MRWLKEYWPEAVPVLVLLALKSRVLFSDLLPTFPLWLIGLTVLVVGFYRIKGYHHPLTTALWLMAIVVLLTGSIVPIAIELQQHPRGLWPWAYLASTYSLAAWIVVVWLSGRLARNGLSFAFLLCAAYLAYTFTSPSILAGISDPPVLLRFSLRVAAGSNTVAVAATIAVLMRQFPALDRDARRRGLLLLLAFPLVDALIRWLAFTVYLPSDESVWDRFMMAVALIVPYTVMALVLLGATRLAARRHLPAKPQYSD